MQAIVGTQYFKNSEVIAPGKVGSVGDVLTSVRLKQSAPDMAQRYDKDFSGMAESFHGNNVQDGFSYSFTSGGGPARTLDSRLERTSFKTNHGWRYQDLRSVDKTLEPVMGSLGRASWNNMVANTYQAKITGNAFLPLPGAYGPRGMTRGSQIPRIVAVDTPVMPDLQQPLSDPNLKGVVAALCYDDTGRAYLRRTNKPPPGKQAPSSSTPPGQSERPPTVSNQPAPEPVSDQDAEKELRNAGF